MSLVDAVVKVGGSFLRDPASHHAAVSAIADAATRWRLLVVPGGGPFADLVRLFDRAMSLGDDGAHWLAIRAMDAHAELLAARLPDARVVELAEDIADALAARQIPVLAPSQWLRERDPLPHSWQVTSDSIAAWVAGELGAPKLVLLKPVSGEAVALSDEYFRLALPETVQAIAIGVDELSSGRLRGELGAAAVTN